MKCIDEKKMKLLQTILKFKEPLDEEKGVGFYVKGEEFNLETVFVKKMLAIANNQPIEILEKEDLFFDLVGLVYEMKKGLLDDDKIALTKYEIDDEGKLKETKIESIIDEIITDLVDMQQIEDKEKGLLYQAILSLVCEVKENM